MSFISGDRLQYYEITGPLGAGGMGVVYQARDTKLGRDVAIKVLPEDFAANPERLARFQREAKVLASLNHPNIAAIYGLEESDGVHFLVLELVPGETLAERIASGRLSVEEALEIASQIAEALEEAHESGIVHRDLKPANVKITPDGKVKVLDFGLAKAFAEDSAQADSSLSPTLTRDATRAGVILGTAAYMSPEQARGKSVDKRSDIFSFGCVLYEMLTGRKAFDGEEVSDILAAVLKTEPDFEVLPTNLRSQLTFEGMNNFEPTWTPDGAKVAFSSDRLGEVTTHWKAADGSGEAELLLERDLLHFPASWSPDGRLLAIYEFHPENQADVWVVSVDDGSTSAVTTTEFAERSPMFSPKGNWIAYQSDRSGRPEVYVQPYPGTGGRRRISSDGGTEPLWARDGKEIFFRNEDKMMVVAIDTSEGFQHSAPRELFSGNFETDANVPNYDVHPDGDRFVMIRSPEMQALEIHVVVNWFES